MADRPRIVVVGSTMTDLVVYADRLPEDGETLVGRSFTTGFGGKGANQAVMAARLGATVTMVNAVGRDGYGDATIENLGREGIATSSVARVAQPSGVAHIWVDGAGGNRIVIVPGANRDVPPSLAAEAVHTVRPTVVVGQFEIPQAVTLAGFAAARAIGALTVLNPAPAEPLDPALLAATDWLVPNETEFAALAGVPLSGQVADDEAAVAAYGARVGVGLVVTLGERGALVAPRGERVRRVAAERVTAVDTTGAGDAFVGGFAVGLASGWSPVAAATLGCAVASDSVTRPGTQRSYADADAAATILEATRATAAI